MSIKTEMPDLIQRPDADIESDSESESTTQDTFLPWTTNESITQIGVTEAYEAPFLSDSRSDFDLTSKTPNLARKKRRLFKSSTRLANQNKTARK